MFLYSPPESNHSLNDAALFDPKVALWGAWSGEQLAGCGGLKELTPDHAELKAMRTAKAFLRQGVSRQILEVILTYAKAQGFKQLSLETGTHDAFMPSRKLYEGFGFVECEPFGDYEAHDFSTFMTLVLSSGV